MSFPLPKNPNGGKYQSVYVEGEPVDPRCSICEANGERFCLYHVTKKWVYYLCFECEARDKDGKGIFRVPRRYA